MNDIKNYSLQELTEIIRKFKFPAYQAGNIFAWLYQKGATEFSSMTNIPQRLRQELEKVFCIGSIIQNDLRVSSDGTKKFLFGLGDGQSVEGVMIPAQSRRTACISTQAGCLFACRFCASGVKGFIRNLTCSEILQQVQAIQQSVLPVALTHVVFMGAGEPLDNYDAVLKSIRILNAKEGFSIGARRITISTCGLVPGIRRLQEEGLQIELSVSLHAANDETRSGLMPVNLKYPLKVLLEACRQYIRQTNRQITFEYILAKDINCDLKNARQLSIILRGLLCKVNLIPCNPVRQCGIQPPEAGQIARFKEHLLKQGIVATVRRSRGEDIEAACGQLRLRYEK
jgi:23S rRNA (adenine2503-C2)-methyltransferase